MKFKIRFSLRYLFEQGPGTWCWTCSRWQGTRRGWYGGRRSGWAGTQLTRSDRLATLPVQKDGHHLFAIQGPVRKGLTLDSLIKLLLLITLEVLQNDVIILENNLQCKQFLMEMFQMSHIQEDVQLEILGETLKTAPEYKNKRRCQKKQQKGVLELLPSETKVTTLQTLNLTIWTNTCLVVGITQAVRVSSLLELLYIWVWSLFWYLIDKGQLNDDRNINVSGKRAAGTYWGCTQLNPKRDIYLQCSPSLD